MFTIHPGLLVSAVTLSAGVSVGYDATEKDHSCETAVAPSLYSSLTAGEDPEGQPVELYLMVDWPPAWVMSGVTAAPFTDNLISALFTGEAPSTTTACNGLSNRIPVCP